MIPWKAILILTPLVVWWAFSCSGCATFDRHWEQRFAPSPKPWYYVHLEDVESHCKTLQGNHTNGRVLACAQPTKRDCTIYLPKDPPQWLVEHEEKHCRGWLHD